MDMLISIQTLASHESVLTRARWSVGDRQEEVWRGREEEEEERGAAASASCTGATGDSADLCARAFNI